MVELYEKICGKHVRFKMRKPSVIILVSRIFFEKGFLVSFSFQSRGSFFFCFANMGNQKNNNKSNSDDSIPRAILGRKRKKRNNLCLQDKLQVVDLLENGKSEGVIANLLGNVSKSQIHNISVNREKLRKLDGTIPPTAKRMKNESLYPEIDQAVLKWVNLMRNPDHRWKPLPLSRTHVQVRARIEAELRGVTGFEASDGWFRNWRRRCLIGVSTKLYGEAGDVNVAEMEPLIEQLRDKLRRFSPNNVFNMDETGLFYRALPNRTYLSPAEGMKKKVRGCKFLKAKDRITLVLCVNVTGN